MRSYSTPNPYVNIVIACKCAADLWEAFDWWVRGMIYGLVPRRPPCLFSLLTQPNMHKRCETPQVSHFCFIFGIRLVPILCNLSSSSSNKNPLPNHHHFTFLSQIPTHLPLICFPFCNENKIAFHIIALTTIIYRHQLKQKYVICFFYKLK